MTKEGDDDSKARDENRRKEGDTRPNIRFKGFEYRITKTPADHHDGELTKAQIQENFILIFYLYGDFVLHVKSAKL